LTPDAETQNDEGEDAVTNGFYPGVTVPAEHVPAYQVRMFFVTRFQNRVGSFAIRYQPLDFVPPRPTVRIDEPHDTDFVTVPFWLVF
jgi:hypothetical protein